MVRIGIIGASGRMGRELIQATLDNPRAELAAAVTRPGNALLGTDAGELIGAGRLGVDLGADLETALATVDVAIDFTLADALTANLAACQATGRPMVVGTTGLTAAHRRAVDVAARDIPMVLAPNFSAGISLAFRLIEMAARALGDDFDVEVIEAHHRHKVDAPSGTAVRMGEVLAGALDRDLATCAVYGREGQIGARERRTIGFETIRGGDIVGEHTVLFAGLGERLEITHRASSRMTFASGAVRAAVWLHEQAPGLYGMEDVLGLRQG